MVSLAAVLLLCICLAGWHVLDSGSGNVNFGVIDSVGISDEKLQEMADEIVDDSLFQIFINTDMTLDSDGMTDFLVQNTVQNFYDCYIELLNEDGESVYTSDVIQPGYKLERDVVKSGLHDGSNACLVYFHVLDDAGQEINQIGVNVTVTKI